MTEIFKVKSEVAQEIMTEIIKFKDHSHDLRENHFSQRQIIKSCTYGSLRVSNLGAKLYDILPENVKKTQYLQDFEKKTKFWTQLIVLAKYVRHVQLLIFLRLLWYIIIVLIYFHNLYLQNFISFIDYKTKPIRIFIFYFFQA